MMRGKVRRAALALSLAATMALAGAGPGLAGPKGKGPKLVTGNPPKTTVIHCKRAFPGTRARGVMILKVRKNRASARNNCRGIPAGAQFPAPLAQRLLEILGGRPVPPALAPFMP